MRLFLLVLSAAIAAACGSATDPHNVNCLAPGDTIGFAPIVRTADSTILSCIFVTETKTRCYLSPPQKYTASDCVVGTKWTG